MQKLNLKNDIHDIYAFVIMPVTEAEKYYRGLDSDRDRDHRS